MAENHTVYFIGYEYFCKAVYNPNILYLPYYFVIMYNNQASQELQSMIKTSLGNICIHISQSHDD